jgi:hypothetical protein
MSEAEIASMEQFPFEQWIPAPEGVTRATAAIERVIVRDLSPHAKALVIERDGREIARVVLDPAAARSVAARLTTFVEAAS